MRLLKIQDMLKEIGLQYSYTEEDGCGSIDFEHRGLKYHIWEFADEETPCGVETNIFLAGRSEDIQGDYEAIVVEELSKSFR